MNNDKYAPTPYLKAIILCDSAIVDETTKKKTLVGIFDQVAAAKFPTNHHTATIYARLIDAEGSYDFTLQYVQVSSDRTLGELAISQVQIPDRLATYELIIRLPPLYIPEPGEYEFRIWANKKYVGSTSFKALQAKQ